MTRRSTAILREREALKRQRLHEALREEIKLVRKRNRSNRFRKTGSLTA